MGALRFSSFIAMGWVRLFALAFTFVAFAPGARVATAKTKGRSPFIDHFLTSKKKQLGITSVEQQGHKYTLIQEGFDRIVRGVVWLDEKESQVAFLEHGAGGATLTFDNDKKATTFEVVQDPTIAGALLLKSLEEPAKPYPYLLVDERDPFLWLSDALTFPVELDKSLLFDSPTGKLMVPKSKFVVGPSNIKGTPSLKSDYYWLSAHEDGTFSVALESDPSVLTERLSAPPDDFGKFFHGESDKTGEALFYRKSDLALIKKFDHLEKDLGAVLKVRQGEFYHLVSKVDLNRISPALEEVSKETLSGNWQGILANLDGRVLIHGVDPGIYSKPYEPSPDWKGRDLGTALLVNERTSEDKDNKAAQWKKFYADFGLVEEPRTRPKQKLPSYPGELIWQRGYVPALKTGQLSFLIQKANPSQNSPSFFGAPYETDDSFFVQVKPDAWQFLDKKNVSSSSIEVSTHARIESIADAWCIHHPNGQYQLIEKTLVKIHTELLKEKPKRFGESVQIRDDHNQRQLLATHNFKLRSRPFVGDAIDYGSSVAVRSPGENGLWYLLDTASPTNESIPFRRILKGQPDRLSRIRSTPTPTRILVEDESGKSVWLSTKTLKAESGTSGAN